MKQYLKMILELPFGVKWLLVTELFYGFAMGIWGVNLNLHINNNGFSDSSVGNIIAFGSIITALVSLVAGGLCDRFGYNPGMIFGCIIRAVGIVVMSIVPRFEFIIIGQLLFGVGGAFISTSEFPLLLSLIKDKYVQVVYNLSFCVYQLSMFFGNIAGGLMPGWMHKQFHQYGMSILICGVMFALMGIGRLFLPKTKSASSSSVKVTRNFLKNPMVLWFLAFGLLGGFSSNIILPLSMVNSIYKQNFGLSDTAIGIVYSLSTLISCIAFFIAPVILERFNNSYIAIGALIINCLIFMIFSIAGIKIFVFAWLAFSFFDSMLPGAVESHMIRSVSLKDRGTYCGLGIFANSIGMGLGSSVSGFALTYMNYSILMIIGAVSIVLQLYVYFHGCRKHLETHEENEWDQIVPIKMTA